MHTNDLTRDSIISFPASPVKDVAMKTNVEETSYLKTHLSGYLLVINTKLKGQNSLKVIKNCTQTIN